MRRAIFSSVLFSLSLAAAGCGSGRASDGDIVRFCRLVSRCTGVAEATCDANTRASRDEAQRAGCSGQLGSALRCAVSADVCETHPSCVDENERLEACASAPSPDSGIVIPDSGTIPLLDSGSVITPSPVRQGVDGMIEIFHDGEWRPICDDGFSMVEAEVACRHLGFSGAAGYSTVTGPTDTFWLDDVSCDGTERWLDECDHGGWGYDNCSASETQAVECF